LTSPRNGTSLGQKEKKKVENNVFEENKQKRKGLSYL